VTDQSAFHAIAPDPAAIARYLDVVFGYLDGYVPLRVISEKGTKERRPIEKYARADDPALVTMTLEQARYGHANKMAVYVVPGVVAAAGRAHTDDVVASGVLLVDLDVGDVDAKRDYLARHLGRPTLEIASGGVTPEGRAKRHLYWRLTEAAIGADFDTLMDLRARIGSAAGGDPSFDRRHQPIRVAGTVHGKYGKTTLVRILEDTGIEYELAELAERVAELPDAPEFARPDDARRAGNGFTASETMTGRFREGAQDGQSRFSAISKVIGHWLRMMRKGLTSRDEAWRAVDEFNAACIQPPWPQDKLRREFEGLLRYDVRRNGPMPTAGSRDDADRTPPPLSDDFLAAAFAERHVATWRHVAAWGAWMRWSGARWERDEVHALREAVRLACRAAVGPDVKEAEARRVTSDKTIRAVERLAAGDPRLAARADDWDVEPHLLNTPGGVVDLETGEVMPHEPRRMLTQMTAASLGGVCPHWRAFVAEIAGGDAELAGYLQRLAGYCLSASTEEQIFAFLYGTGANGKSVFLSTLSAVLGGYAAAAPLSAFTATKSDAHPTDLAGLVGKRLVSVSETEAGRAWAESRIKTITGGDRLRARFLHRDFFEFTPTFKLLVAGNHRPRLNGVGEAMRRRMHLVPFAVTIPPERRDRGLATRLLAERDGVLGWMVEGYADWRARGLAPPEAVVQSATEYFEEEDLIGQWIEQECVTEPTARATARQLFTSWSAWAQAAGAEIGSQKTLGDALRERGFVSRKVVGQRGWIGIGLRRGGAGAEE
jgi:P4 family phage/plasmid primase-like protien